MLMVLFVAVVLAVDVVVASCYDCASGVSNVLFWLQFGRCCDIAYSCC